MDYFGKLKNMTTYKFAVGKTRFNIVAENRVNAFSAANCKIREEKLAPNDFSFAWFDATEPNSFYLGEYSSFD